MTDLHQRILAAIDAEETIAKAAERDCPSPWMRSMFRIGLPDMAEYIAAQDPATTLRRLAEDRDVLARHAFVDWYEGGTGCWYCSGEENAEHRIVDWPCPDVLSVARRHGIDPTA
jgi:hypothetical protein